MCKEGNKDKHYFRELITTNTFMISHKAGFMVELNGEIFRNSLRTDQPLRKYVEYMQSITIDLD